MSHQEETPRRYTPHTRDEQQQQRDHRADELAQEPQGRDARGNPEKQRENRRRMGVDDGHKTGKMNKERRGTFP